MAEKQLGTAPSSPTDAATKTYVDTAISGAISTTAALAAGNLTATSVKTANYTAAASEIVSGNASGGAFTVTLPANPTDNTRIVVKKIDSSVNAVTVQCSGDDKFDSATGSSSLALSIPGQTISVHYEPGIWFVVGGASSGTSNSFAATIGNGSATSIAVTHNLGTLDVVVSVFLVATGEEVDCDVIKTSGNVITLNFATAPASSSLRCTVIGTAFGTGTPPPVASTGITDATSIGRSVLTAADAAAVRTAIGAGTSSLALGTTSSTAKAGNYQPTSANISDATATGRSVLTAADAAAARAAISVPPKGKTIYVEDYRDGVRTDSQMITAAFDAVEPGGEVRFGQGVTYTTTGDLVISTNKSDLLVNGQGATITGTSTSVALSIRGFRYAGTLTTLTSAITSRTDTLTVASTAGWAVGDMMRLSSSAELWSPNYASAGVSAKSEMCRVKAIPDGTTFTLDARTWDTYSITGNTVSARQYAPVKNMTIRDLTVVGNYADDGFVGLDIRHFDGLRLEGIIAKGCGNVGIKVAEGIDVTGTDCRVEDTQGSSNGYGFSCTDVLSAQWVGCYGLRNRHTFDAHLTRDLKVVECAVYHDRSAGISTHASTDTVKYLNNTVRECGGGIITRGRNTVISGNHILGTRVQADQFAVGTYRSGILIGQGSATYDGIAGENLVIDGNLIDLSGPTYGVWPIEGDRSGLANGIDIVDPLVRAKITNNTIRNFPTHGIYCRSDYNTSADISGNLIDCSQQVGNYKSGIIFEPWETAAANVHTGLMVQDNVITGTNASTHSGIRISGGSTTSPRTDDLFVSGNKITECQTSPIFLGGTYFYSEDLPSPYTDTFMPRTGGYFGSNVRVHDNITETDNPVSWVAENFSAPPLLDLPFSVSTVTAAGTTTLTSTSPRVQIFTGSTTQTVRLPTTNVVAGQEWKIVNLSSYTVTVQSSDASTVIAVWAGRHATFRANVDAPTTAANWKAEAPNAGALSGTIAERDSRGWLNSTAFVPASTSTASSAGTLTMANTSTQVQVITGSTTHTVRLPSTSVGAGMQYTIVNQSSGEVTVQSSAANTITTVTGGTAKLFVALQATPTADTHWRAI